MLYSTTIETREIFMNEKTMYMSFLGIYDYTLCCYTWGTENSTSKFVQVAELDILFQRQQTIDTITIFGTISSKTKHWNDLETDIRNLLTKYHKTNVDVFFEELSEIHSTQEQWKDFQKILFMVPMNSYLIIDLTNGFRSIPIVFSSALNFLQLIKSITIQHVLYGVISTDSMIVDYADFYSIHEWTTALSQLLENADARRIASIAQNPIALSVPTFSTQSELNDALIELTEAIRNVKVHVIEERATNVLHLVQKMRELAQQQEDSLGIILLNAIQEKFVALTEVPPANGEYNASYFSIQLRLAKLLLEHDLNMQAFTVLDELIGSLGLRYYKLNKTIRYTNSEGRGKRRIADVFKLMIKIDKNKWVFHSEQQTQVDALMNVYNYLARDSTLSLLKDMYNKISDIRNKLNHAWTSKNPHEQTDISKVGTDIVHKLESILDSLPTQDALALWESTTKEHL